MDENPRVETDGISSEEVDAMIPVLKEFAKKIGRDIEVNCPHGESLDPYEGDEYGLCIYFWCVPKDCGGLQRPTAYGYRLGGGQKDGYLLPNNSAYPGKRIVDTEGYDVALIVGKTLYVLFDLSHVGRYVIPDNAAKILKLILDDYLLYLSHEILFNKEMRRRLETEGQFEQFSRAYRLGYHKSAKGELEEISKKIRCLREELSIKVRERKILSDWTGQAVDDAKIHGVYDHLCALSSNGGVSVSNNGSEVIIPVGQIDIEHEGVVYDIGEFGVAINFEKCTIRCHNITGQHDSFHHPHIGGDGECCLGEASYGIGVLLGNLELETVVSMMVQFLKSYDPNSCLADINNWPVKRR